MLRLKKTLLFTFRQRKRECLAPGLRLLLFDQFLLVFDLFVLTNPVAGHSHHKGSSKKLLGAPGIATRSKDATRGSWPYY